MDFVAVWIWRAPMLASPAGGFDGLAGLSKVELIQEAAEVEVCRGGKLI